jgi:hypothetical protein
MALGAARLSAQQPVWAVDVSAAALVEAWDANEERESLAGIVFGADRAIARGTALRGEGMLLRVRQPGHDALLGGMTIGTRLRRRSEGVRPYVDVGVGIAMATEPVPLRGTAFNYLAQAGGGFEVSVDDITVALVARWLHISNAGRVARDRNPDIQALGFLVAIGWSQ